MNRSILDDFKQTWNTPNNILVQLILINVIVFVSLRLLEVLFVFTNMQDFFDVILTQLSIPSNIAHLFFRPWSLVTYFFTHYSFNHILFNMLSLYWFGKIVRDLLGEQKVLSIYVLGGLLGGLLFVVAYNLVPMYSERVGSSVMIGASGGVTAIIVAAAVFVPNYTLYLFLLGPVKIKYIAMVLIFLSFIGTTGSNAGGEIAHLGGAFIGWLFIYQLRKGNDHGEWIIKMIVVFKKMFKPRPKIKVTHTKYQKNKFRAKSSYKIPVNEKITPPDQKEIDEILDKISEFGYESLTKTEKQKLFYASKHNNK